MSSVEEHILRWERKCVFREYCKYDVRLDLMKKKVAHHEIQKIIEKLEQSDFINESRYVQAFFNDHFRIQKWGPYKIQQKLREKRLPEYLIQKVCNQYDKHLMMQNLKEIYTRKLQFEGFEEPLTIEQRNKISRYLIQKGYPMDTLQNIYQ